MKKMLLSWYDYRDDVASFSLIGLCYENKIINRNKMR